MISLQFFIKLYYHVNELLSTWIQQILKCNFFFIVELRRYNSPMGIQQTKEFKKSFKSLSETVSCPNGKKSLSLFPLKLIGTILNEIK